MTSSEKTRTAMTAVLAGERRGVAGKLLFVGPAVIASVAYMDPGNYATNIQAGAGYGRRGRVFAGRMGQALADGEIHVPPRRKPLPGRGQLPGQFCRLILRNGH